MNDNNRKVQHYAGLVQVSNSIFILADATAMSVLQAWGYSTGIAYLCAASSFICGVIGLRCSKTPTIRFRQCSHAISFINIGTFYGFGMVMLGTFGFLLDHKRRYPLTLLLVHMAYTLFGLVNICCAMMQAKSVGLKPLFCQNYPSRYESYERGSTNPQVAGHGRFCACHLSTHPSDLTENEEYPPQLQVMLPVNPDGTVYIDAPLTSVDIIAFDSRPISTPPPAYEELAIEHDSDPPPAYSDVEGNDMGVSNEEPRAAMSETRQTLQDQLHNDNTNKVLANQTKLLDDVASPSVQRGEYDV